MKFLVLLACISVALANSYEWRTPEGCNCACPANYRGPIPPPSAAATAAASSGWNRWNTAAADPWHHQWGGANAWQNPAWGNRWNSTRWNSAWGANPAWGAGSNWAGNSAWAGANPWASNWNTWNRDGATRNAWNWNRPNQWGSRSWEQGGSDNSDSGSSSSSSGSSSSGGSSSSYDNNDQQKRSATKA